MFGPAAAQTAVLGFFFCAHGVSWKFFVVVGSCGNLSLCNLRTCHQPFRFHPHLTAPVHGVYRTCPASEGEGRRRNDATYSTGSLPCPGLSASAPRSLLSHTPMVFRFIIHLVELFAGSVSRHYLVRVYKQKRDGGCCRCSAIDVGSSRWHAAHSTVVG